MKKLSNTSMIAAGLVLSLAAATVSAETMAVKRTREQVKMLDDLYKTVVVLVTEHYVTDPSVLSGASAGKALFAAMKEKGWHEVRLIGLTEVINNTENLPRDDFEKTAAQKISAGESSYERVVSEGNKAYLRYATPVPVVMEKCVMCHANFKGKKGAIGSLMYKLPLIQ